MDETGAHYTEWSHKDKEHYSILTHIYGIYKDGNDNPTCKTEKETQMYKTDFWTLGEGEGGKFRENSIETCILSRVKQIRLDAWDKCTGLVHWEDPEGSGGEGGGRGDRDGEYM